MDMSYATHSRFSDPGAYAPLLEDVPHDLAGISRIAQGLVYHYVADQHIFGYCPPHERLPEIDTRFMEQMLARLTELDPRSLSVPRAYENRLVGCCRDFALVACAILRQRNQPARLRYGFAGYFVPGYWIDHVIVETWDGARWQRFDPEIPAAREWGFNVLDVPETAFVTGGRAWQLARNGETDPAVFGLGPAVSDVSGWWFLRGRLQLDLAALMKQEMLCWDEWGFVNPAGGVSTADELLLDQAAALSLQPDSGALRTFIAAEPRLRVPETVTCVSPAAGPHPITVATAGLS